MDFDVRQLVLLAAIPAVVFGLLTIVEAKAFYAGPSLVRGARLTGSLVMASVSLGMTVVMLAT